METLSNSWHVMKVNEVMHSLDVTHEGLTHKEVQERQKRYGYNELKERKRRTAFQIFFDEFKDIFVILLIVAAVFSAIIGYHESNINAGEGFEIYSDAITIIVIVLLCVITGFVQEYRAEKAMQALKKLAAPRAIVIRNGKEIIISAREVVPGDILVLETGNRIPADAYLIKAIELKTDEAILTGESNPVKKEVTVLREKVPITERKNMIFSGTHVVYGRGKAVVVSTGMNTEFGKIAEMIQTTEEVETPLKKKLNKFAKKVAKIVVIICVVIFVIEAFKVLREGLKIEGLIQAFMSSVSLAISAVPEGLPAVVTISLALGAREFAKRNAIIRKLSSAESLGAVTFISSDKTGTLTRGEMTVKKVFVGGQIFDVTGVGYEPKGKFYLKNKIIKPSKYLLLLLRIGALCNNAKLEKDEENGTWKILGDPTEGALIVSAEKARLGELEELYPRIDEIPFTSERKRMTIIRLIDKENFAYMKGALEVVLERCNYILENGKENKLTRSKREKILEMNEKLANEGLRVLAMAYKKLPRKAKEFDEKNVEENLVFVGSQGMIDPAREEAIEANRKCQKAGIKTVMITGDHKLTAIAIAKEIGILKEGDLILTGKELDKMKDEEFEKIVEKVSVYARLSPEHKLRIVKALQKKGHIVAMTGDGVNDAPAIKAADVGVAMGISGTDVTREASDLILTDDNFATIVNAVERGRIIYNNIRKYARFLISCNFDELLVIGMFAILGGIFGEKLFPLPLLPAMILWINLVTDGAPAIALATEHPDEDVMERPPRKPEEGILHGMGAFIIASFLLQAIGTVLVFSLEYYIWPAHGFGTEATLAEARTAAFIQAAMFELFIVWNCRSEKRSVWRMGKDAFKNKFFVIATFASMFLTLGITYIPITQQMFHLVPLSLTDIAYVLGVASWGLFVLPEVFMKRTK